MQKLSIVFIFAFAFLLTACSQKPMTEADMAASYGLSMEEFQEQKEAAARMNMSIEDHLGNMDNMHEHEMDMDMESHGH